MELTQLGGTLQTACCRAGWLLRVFGLSLVRTIRIYPYPGMGRTIKMLEMRMLVANTGRAIWLSGFGVGTSNFWTAHCHFAALPRKG